MFDLQVQLRSHNLGRKFLARRLLSRFQSLPAPRRLIVEPISACNYRCPKCVYPEMARARTTLDCAAFEKFLTGWASVYGAFDSLEFTGAGEVLLLRDFPAVVEAAARVMPETRLVTTSNLSLLAPEVAVSLVRAGLREWQISLDSADPAEYARMAGLKSADLNSVLENIRFLWSVMSANPSPRNRLTILAHRPYDAEYASKIAQIEALVHAVCHHFAASPYQSLNGRKSGDFVLSEQLLYTEDRHSVPCGYLWTDLVVVNDGSVRVCCSDMFDSPVNFGNIFTDTPQQLVGNRERRRYQEAMAQGHLSGLYLCETCHAPKA